MLSTTTPTTETEIHAPLAAAPSSSPSWNDQAIVVANPETDPPGHRGRGADGYPSPGRFAPSSPTHLSDNRALTSASPIVASPGDSTDKGQSTRSAAQARSARRPSQGKGGGQPSSEAPTPPASPIPEEGAGQSQPEPLAYCAAPSSPWDAIVTLSADILDDIERARISAENQLRAALDSKGLDPALNAQHLAPLEGLVQGLRDVEAQAVKRLESAMRHHPLGAWVAETQGLGAKTVGRFLGAVGPLQSRTMPSQLWAYCGLHVIDGHAPRRRRGEQANWSTRAKTRAYLMAEACVKLIGVGGKRRSPYRDVYDASRALDELRQADRSEPLTDGHMHARAMRKVSKAILADMWAEARKGVDHGEAS